MSLLAVYGVIHLSSWLYFLSTAEKFIFDDGNSKEELYRCDVRALPSEIDSALNLSNKTGVLYSYSVLGEQMLSSAPYVSGELDGVVSNWYKNGILRTTDTYIAGKRHGEFSWFYPDGGKKSHIIYRNGEAVCSKTWFENGMLKSVQEFYELNGLVKNTQRWNEQGVLIESFVNDINQNPTSGFIHVNAKRDSSDMAVAYDVVGKTNFIIRAKQGKTVRIRFSTWINRGMPDWGCVK